MVFRRALLCVVTASIFLALASPTVADGPMSSIPLTVDEHGTLFVPALAAGRRVLLLLDTGASHSSLRPSIARSLRLTRAGELPVQSLGVTRRMTVAMLPSLVLGSVTVRDLPVLVFDPALERASGLPVDGVLGQDVLARFNYSLDLRRRRLAIEVHDELESRVQGTPVAFHRVSDRPVVDAVLNGTRRRMALALDSGASHLVLFDRGNDAVTGVEAGMPTRVLTQAGGLRARTARVRLLETGASRLYEVEGVVVEAGSRDEDGLLPMSLFDGVYVNNRLGWLVFNPTWQEKGTTTGRRAAGIPAATQDRDR